jgi:hypothetical protein
MNNFVKGIIFGSGFGLGLVIIALIVIGILFLSPLKFGDSPNSIVGTDAIIINEHRLEFIDGKPMIYGSLTNSTNKKLSSVMIEGSLFNKDECFIDKNTEYIDSLSPNEKFGFKIRFYDWKDAKKGTNLTYKVRIKQGFDRE